MNVKLKEQGCCTWGKRYSRMWGVFFPLFKLHLLQTLFSQTMHTRTRTHTIVFFSPSSIKAIQIHTLMQLDVSWIFRSIESTLCKMNFQVEVTPLWAVKTWLKQVLEAIPFWAVKPGMARTSFASLYCFGYSMSQCVLWSLEAHILQNEFPLQTVTTGMARASFASLHCLGHLMSHAYLDL